ncbi:3-deoxy-D-manno-octulosonate 8-phosphate phosphatase [Advenella kashmirensis W13003]|uniref:3-deoxy-D-manno-octulosonate 8-phosphate phosphatase KdsC n=1 Tax=Advenella kashmirensis W13003 TaxID=1424334 RepID=V8QVW8_9BURK|nr:HAD hydrolase family protein [Advenella kashmirensis]ETF03139.1 3-deoxy-D-manno-octulosonate 8-phosphate phosphatase [Advenella kashmirensis W13003]
MKPINTPHPAEALVLSKISQSVRDLAAQVKLIAFDVDGILTDGSLWYGEHGELMKRFCALDGHGLKMLQQAGVRVVLITGREGDILSRRAADLGLADVFQNVRDKIGVLSQLATDMGLGLENIAFMGDDIIDLPAMQKCGFSISVPNAPLYVQQTAHWVTSLPGGSGAVRECTDLIMAAQGTLSGFFTPGRLTGAVIQ